MENKKNHFIFINLLAIFLISLFLFPPTVFAEENDGVSVLELNDQIAQKKKEIEDLRKQSEVYEQNIKIKQTEAVNLKNQMAILDNQIAKIKVDIKTTEVEIEESNLELQDLTLGIKEKENKIKNQKEILAELVRQIYNNDDKNSLEVLILNESFSEFFSHLSYLEEVATELQTSLNKVRIFKEQLESQRQESDSKRQQLETFKKELESRKEKLDERMKAKGSLLIETRNSELKFKTLFTQLKEEQQQIDSEIVDLEGEIRSRLEPSKIGSIEGGLIWPVNPIKGLSALFHDPEYPLRYIFEHPAVDIRTPQRTPVKAAASGYVAKAKNGGYGYSYVMLIHDQGISTIYGHVNKILVKEDTYVKAGDIIALSGGLPGTLGAGRLTTGPHLHFEVRLNGIPVNPLEYLP